jgi:HEAT repeat protein/cyclophilin family peptidyl-prolyl cis-trans isomerase
MLHSKCRSALSALRRLTNHRVFSVNRKSAPMIGILCLVTLNACSRLETRNALEQNQYFVEILKRVDRGWPEEDGFFENSLLSNPNPEVRQWAAVAMGRIANPRALPLLYKALHIGDAAVRAASVFAIGEIEDRGLLKQAYRAPLSDAVTEVNNLLDDPSIAVRTRAVEALGKIGSGLEAAEIARRLNSFEFDGNPAERVYLEAGITALVRLGDPAACPVLEKLARKNNYAIRSRALDALFRLGSKTAIPLFVSALKDPNPEIRSCAARGLGIAGDPDFANMLLPLLSSGRAGSADYNPLSVRISALQALGKLANPSAIPFIKAALLTDSIDKRHPDQQHFAIQAAATLGDIGRHDGVAVLLPLLKTPGPVANGAVVALAKILKANPERFFNLVDRNMFSHSDALRAWIQAMAELGGSVAAEELKQMLVQAIEQHGPTEASMLPLILKALGKAEAPGLQDTLMPFLRSRDAGLSRAAVAVYRPKPGAKAPWEPIIQAFTASAGCSNVQARVDILSHLKPWIARENVQQVLRSGLADPERNVRLACAALLRRAGATDIREVNTTSEGTLTDALCRVLAAERKDTTIAQLYTNRGSIEIELFREDAPVTTASFALMASGGAFDGMEFEQTMPLQVIEGRNLEARTEGGRAISSEVNMRPFERGSVGMEVSRGYSRTGRFFIALAPQPYRDGVDTCFGRVVSGMQVADRILPGDQILRILIKHSIAFQDYFSY